MGSSIFLAKILGIYLVVVSLAFLADRGLLKAVISIYKNKVILFLSGVVNLLVGAAIILTHNLWLPDWRSLITLLGWFAVGKGLVRIFWPDKTRETLKKTQKGSFQKYALIACLVLGFYLLLVGLTS